MSAPAAPRAPRPLAPSVHTLSAEFVRSWRAPGGTAEISKGHLYYDVSGKILVDVREPLHQIMQVEGEHVRVYYPVGKQAFDILTGSPQVLPFFQTLLATVDESFGLATQGYTLSTHVSRGDTLVTEWDPPLEARKALGRAVLTTRQGHLIQAEVLAASGSCLVRYICSNTIRIAGLTFPTNMETHVLIGVGRGLESVEYSAIEVNRPLPAWVPAFQLPKDTKVKKLQ